VSILIKGTAVDADGHKVSIARVVLLR
jgi:hypothetical protein